MSLVQIRRLMPDDPVSSVMRASLIARQLTIVFLENANRSTVVYMTPGRIVVVQNAM